MGQSIKNKKRKNNSQDGGKLPGINLYPKSIYLLFKKTGETFPTDYSQDAGLLDLFFSNHSGDYIGHTTKINENLFTINLTNNNAINDENKNIYSEIKLDISENAIFNNTNEILKKIFNYNVSSKFGEETIRDKIRTPGGGSKKYEAINLDPILKNNITKLLDDNKKCFVSKIFQITPRPFPNMNPNTSDYNYKNFYIHDVESIQDTKATFIEINFEQSDTVNILMEDSIKDDGKIHEQIEKFDISFDNITSHKENLTDSPTKHNEFLYSNFFNITIDVSKNCTSTISSIKDFKSGDGRNNLVYKNGKKFNDLDDENKHSMKLRDIIINIENIDMDSLIKKKTMVNSIYRQFMQEIYKDDNLKDHYRVKIKKIVRNCYNIQNNKIILNKAKSINVNRKNFKDNDQLNTLFDDNKNNGDFYGPIYIIFEKIKEKNPDIVFIFKKDPSNEYTKLDLHTLYFNEYDENDPKLIAKEFDNSHEALKISKDIPFIHIPSNKIPNIENLQNNNNYENPLFYTAIKTLIYKFNQNTDTNDAMKIYKKFIEMLEKTQESDLKNYFVDTDYSNIDINTSFKNYNLDIDKDFFLIHSVNNYDDPKLEYNNSDYILPPPDQDNFTIAKIEHDVIVDNRLPTVTNDILVKFSSNILYGGFKDLKKITDFKATDKKIYNIPFPLMFDKSTIEIAFLKKINSLSKIFIQLQKGGEKQNTLGNTSPRKEDGENLTTLAKVAPSAIASTAPSTISIVDDAVSTGAASDPASGAATDLAPPLDPAPDATTDSAPPLDPVPDATTDPALSDPVPGATTDPAPPLDPALSDPAPPLDPALSDPALSDPVPGADSVPDAVSSDIAPYDIVTYDIVTLAINLALTVAIFLNKRYKNMVKNRIKSHVAKEILSILVSINKNEKKDLPNFNNAAVFGFFNRYNIFEKIAEKFIKFETGFWGVFKTEKLMYTINTKNTFIQEQLNNLANIGYTNINFIYDTISNERGKNRVFNRGSKYFFKSKEKDALYIYVTCNELQDENYNYFAQFIVKKVGDEYILKPAVRGIKISKKSVSIIMSPSSIIKSPLQYELLDTLTNVRTFIKDFAKVIGFNRFQTEDQVPRGLIKYRDNQHQRGFFDSDTDEKIAKIKNDLFGTTIEDEHFPDNKIVNVKDILSRNDEDKYKLLALKSGLPLYDTKLGTFSQNLTQRQQYLANHSISTTDEEAIKRGTQFAKHLYDELFNFHQNEKNLFNKLSGNSGREIEEIMNIDSNDESEDNTGSKDKAKDETGVITGGSNEILSDESDEEEYIQVGGFVPGAPLIIEGLKSSKIFNKKMNIDKDNIQKSKGYFDFMRKKTYTNDDKELLIEFIYKSTYTFYIHILRAFKSVSASDRDTFTFEDDEDINIDSLKFDNNLKLELDKFFNIYIKNIIDLFSDNFDTIITNAPIYLNIAELLGELLEEEIKELLIINDKKNNLEESSSTDENNVIQRLTKKIKEKKLFGALTIFNNYNKKLLDFILGMYYDVREIQKIIKKRDGNIHENIITYLHNKFQEDVLNNKKDKAKEKEEQQNNLINIKDELNSIFKLEDSGTNILSHYRSEISKIDKAIDDFEGPMNKTFLQHIFSEIFKNIEIEDDKMTFSLNENYFDDTLKPKDEEKIREKINKLDEQKKMLEKALPKPSANSESIENSSEPSK